MIDTVIIKQEIVKDFVRELPKEKPKPTKANPVIIKAHYG